MSVTLSFDPAAVETEDTAGTHDRLLRLYKGQEEPEDRRFLGRVASQMRFWNFHGSPDMLGRFLMQGGETAAFNISYVGKQKRGRWGRYVQSHYAWTEPSRRRQGVAKALFRHCEDEWRGMGAGRLKDLIGARLGLYLHRSLGHTIWGLEKNGHLVIDHPLALEFALDGVPTNVSRQIPAAVCPLGYDEGERLFLELGRGREGH